ncbi:ABC transporter permease [Streptomyces caniscabiei]|uniref:ABC transporter permease n=1 Tax=Streptomyces caniscabiei TaxID=2746961 RepID=UPI0038D364B6
MNPRRTFSTALRVLRQLRHDPRTLALVFLMPSVLLIVLYYVFENNNAAFSHAAPPLLGIIPFILMFIVSSIAVLRERTTGTLERLLTSPATKLDILGGYAVAFALLACVQAALASLVTTQFLNVTIHGSEWSLLLVAMLSGVSGMALGLLCSAFARTEFQAVQFMPALVMPQLLICGLFVPRDVMSDLLQRIADVMPITYIVTAMQEVQQHADFTGELAKDVWVIAGVAIGALLLGALSLRSK